jgi:hypothetical protein
LCVFLLLDSPLLLRPLLVQLQLHAEQLRLHVTYADTNANYNAYPDAELVIYLQPDANADTHPEPDANADLVPVSNLHGVFYDNSNGLRDAVANPFRDPHVHAIAYGDPDLLPDTVIHLDADLLAIYYVHAPTLFMPLKRAALRLPLPTEDL